jgi:hypothetical protein
MKVLFGTLFYMIVQGPLSRRSPPNINIGKLLAASIYRVSSPFPHLTLVMEKQLVATEDIDNDI